MATTNAFEGNLRVSIKIIKNAWEKLSIRILQAEVRDVDATE